MKTIRRGTAALLLATMIATAVSALLPAAPVAAVAAPTLALFRGETLATNAEGSATGTLNRLRATLVINHPVGVTVSQMRRRTQQGVAFTAYGAVEGTVATFGNYSVVQAAWVPGTSSWGGCFTSTVRWCDRTAEVDIKMSDGTELGGDWTYRAQTEVQSNGEEDPPTMYHNGDTTVNGAFSGSGSLRLNYTCDDNDSSGDHDACDNVAIRVRNLASGATTLLQCSASTVNCENPTKFNADDGSNRTGNIPLPTSTGRGRFTIEGMFCSESQRDAGTVDCSSTGSGWQWMGSYTFNPGPPTNAFGTPTFVGGGTAGDPLRPNTGASVVYTATASADAQVAYWDLDGNGSGETVELGESGDAGGGPVLSAAQLTKAKDTTGLAEGSSCQVRLQVRDNGGLNVVDPTSALAGNIISPACRVNRQPTGASQTGLTATKGVALPVTLGSADGDTDPRTCQLVGTAVNGSVTFSGGAPATGCTASFTAGPDTSGTASFQYRVLDDHNGVSPTYTISMSIQNRPPTATNQSVTVARGQSTSITLGGTDPDGDATTCETSAPTGGSVSGGTGCTRTYTAPSTPGTHTFTYTRSDAFGGTSAPATVTVTVTAIPGVRGQVTSDDTGAGIPGITVRLYKDGIGFSSITAVTGAQGAYDLGTVPAGTYRVIFKDPDQDFVDEWHGDSVLRSTSTTITIAAGQELPVDAGLAPGAELTVDITNPGTYTVALYDTAPSGASAYRSVPNVSGSTTFRGLPAGTYYASVTDPSGVMVTEWSANQTDRAAAVGIAVGRGASADTGFTLVGRNTISGTVIDSAGPIPSVTVQAYTASGGSFVKSAKTDGEGEYVLRDLPSGGYKLVFRDTSGAHPVTWSGGGDAIGSASTVSVVGGTSETVDEELPLAASVRGTVTGGPDGTTPLAGAKVTLYRSGIAVRTYVTDAAGSYVATGLAPGAYTALFAATGHRTEYHLDKTRKADAVIVDIQELDEVTLDATLAPV